MSKEKKTFPEWQISSHDFYIIARVCRSIGEKVNIENSDPRYQDMVKILDKFSALTDAIAFGNLTEYARATGELKDMLTELLVSYDLEVKDETLSTR